MPWELFKIYSVNEEKQTNKGGNMKYLYRSRKNKVIAGICGGLGNYYNVDPVLIRLITVFLTFFLCFPILVYLVAIFIIPLEPEEKA